MTLFFLFLSCLSFAQNYETTVQDYFFNSSDRVVLTRELIEKTQARDLPSLLATTANIAITSTAFQPSSLSIRGGNSGHVLILVDGIPYYDPSTVQRTGELGTLNIKSIKSIEIVKGSQSVLYGGQAMGGLIKITTFGSGDEQNLLFEGGTQSHKGAAVEFARAGVSAQGFYQERQGESPAKDSRDHYPTQKDNVSLGYRWQNQIDGYVKASHFHDRGYSPTSGNNFEILDTDDFKISGEQTYLGSQVHFKNLKWQPTLSVGLQNGQRAYDFPLSSVNTFALDQKYKSNFQFYRVDMRPFTNATTLVDAGVNYSVESFLYRDTGVKISDAQMIQRGAYAKFTNKLDEVSTFSYGARMESWTNQDTVQAYQVGYTWRKTKVEVSTGYKAPTLYQKYSQYGNPNLKQEKATQYNISQEWQISEMQNLSLSAFYSRFEDLVATVGNFPNLRYVNIDKSETRGTELSFSQFLGLGHSVIVNLGYQEPRNLKTGAWLPRHPLMNGSLRYFYDDFWGNIALEFLGVGPRRDTGPNGVEKLEGYIATNFACNIKLDRTDRFFIRVDNVTSSRYEETYGYFAPRLSAIAGWQGEISF